MKIKEAVMVLLILIIFILPVYAGVTGEEYFEVGNPNGTFEQRNGVFNELITSDTVTGAAVLNNPKMTTLMADLDNDGTQEMIVLDGATFKTYTGNTLTVEDSYVSNMTGQTYFMLYDIDNDGFIEILAASAERKLLILNYTSNAFALQRNYTFSVNPDNEEHENHYIDGQLIIGCRGVEDCLLVYDNRLSSGGGTFTSTNESINGQRFNSTAIDIRGRFFDRAGIASNNCLPFNSHLSAIDYDKDSTKEYIFSAISGDGSADDVHIFYLDINSSNQPQVELDVTFDDIWNVLTQSTACTSTTPGKIFTTPLVHDFVPGGTLETVIAFSKDLDEFKMRMYDSTGTLVRTYPSVLDADGRILSNPIIIDIFGSGQNKDFCVLGYETTGDVLDLLCATENVVLFDVLGLPLTSIRSDEFFFDTSGNFSDVTLQYDPFNTMIHVSEQKSSYPGAEVITPYGVFGVNFNFWNGSTLDLLYTSPHRDASIVALDSEQVGNVDLIAMTTTNLFYIDDGFTNSPGQITQVHFNPCNDAIWKINTTVQVQVTVNDADGDDTASKVTLYAGSSNEHSTEWTGNITNGTIATHSFTANKTIGSGQIIVYGRDSENENVNDSVTFTFSVATNGIEFGDSDCLAFDDPISPDVIGVISINQTGLNTGDNAIVNALDELTGFSGLGRTVIWLIVMVIVAFAIWTGGSHLDPGVTFGVLIIAEILLFFIGSLLGFISIGIVISLIVVSIVAVGIWLGKIMSGSGAAGNGKG